MGLDRLWGFQEVPASRLKKTIGTWRWSGCQPCASAAFTPSPLRQISVVDCVWNVMARAQKPDFVFRRNGRVHLNRRGASVQSTGSRGVRISGGNAGYIMFRGSVKSTGYPHHSPVSPSLPLPCVTVCHHISTGLYSFVLAAKSTIGP
jgi:hypothetical protein